MVYIGDGSDWNYTTDGIPGCTCEIGIEIHTPEELWEMHEADKQTEQKAPDTGEAPVVGICGAIVLVLMAIISMCRRLRR